MDAKPMIAQNRKGFPMALKHALQAVALIVLAGCTPQTSGFIPHTATGGAMRPLAPDMAIAVTSANIHQFAAQDRNAYLVGRGDVLQIHAIDAAELTTPAGYLVEADGAIQVPFLGRVPAAERSTAAIRADLADRLRAYLPNPQVDLRVAEYNARQITVIGDVMRPNRQTLTSRPLTVIDAINAAGGFSQGANMRRVAIVRGGQDFGIDMDAFLTRGATLPLLRDGDILQVGRSAARDLQPLTSEATQGVTLHRAQNNMRRFELDGRPVALLQFLTSTDSGGGEVQVIRTIAAGQQALHFSAADAASPTVAGRFMLQDGDRVFPLMPR
jgi:polysaccharide biosynthesis/export protein